MSAIAWDGAASSTVIVRLVRNCALERTIQWSRELVVETMRRGVLDVPHARGMTAVSGGALCEYIATVTVRIRWRDRTGAGPLRRYCACGAP